MRYPAPAATMTKHRLVGLTLCVALTGSAAVLRGEEPAPRDAPTRWSAERAWTWYARHETLRGMNYLPRTAVNMTEMWQAATFDPKTIDQELGWAAAAGYNTARVFVQYLVWKDDPKGLLKRIDEFLGIAAKHGISIAPILFCDCAFAGREPYLGPQDEPVPGVHNSGWVPSPGLKRVADRAVWPDLERYVKDIVGRFGRDRRVVLWDLYNEPGNSRLGERSLPLAEATFAWARAATPEQPLTTGVWTAFSGRMSARLIELSDIVSFHAYGGPDSVEGLVRQLRLHGRPLVCTEWLRRQVGNTFATILPIFARYRVGAYHWGLVAGRTQTYMHWGSKRGDPVPDVWQHDVFHADGRPYNPRELEILRNFDFEISAERIPALARKPQIRTLLADSRARPQKWRYTLEPPPTSWCTPEFDDSRWAEGDAAFGTRDIPSRAAARTVWTTKDIWLRREFELDSAPVGQPHLLIHHDEDFEVFLGGKEVASARGYTADYVLVPLKPDTKGAFRTGRNIIAVHCRQTGGGQYIDLGLVDIVFGVD